MKLEMSQTQTVDQRRIVFIINPIAKNMGSLKIWNQIKEKLDAKQIQYDAYFTEYRGHGTELAQRVLEEQAGKAILVAVGGDGTIHEVVNGAATYPEAIISTIPAGSGNDFARGFRIPRDPLQALKLVDRQREVHSKPIDLGFYQTDRTGYFVNSLGMGLDAETTDAVNKSTSKLFFNKLGIGKLVYFYFFIQKWWKYTRTNIQVTIDGDVRTFENVWLVNISNQPYFGGGIKISPQSLPDDDLLSIIIVHNLPRIKLLFMFITVLWGGHLKLKAVTSLTGKDIHLLAEQPTFIHVDGDFAGMTEAKVKVHHHKLRVASEEE